MSTSNSMFDAAQRTEGDPPSSVGALPFGRPHPVVAADPPAIFT
jgi:hypothetical protein